MLLLALLAACGGSETHLQGAAAKGPLLLGSSVAVSPLDETGQPLGDVFNTETASDLGDFAVDVHPSGPIRVEATGYYWSEATLDLSAAPITLRAIDEISGEDDVVEVNVLTHLIQPRVSNLVGEGGALGESRDQAQRELVTALAIGTFDPSGWNAADAGYFAGDTDGNAYLFAVSACLGRAAAMTGQSPDAALQDIVNTIAADLESDGTLDSSIVEQLLFARIDLDADAVTSAFTEWAASRGNDAPVPDMMRILPVVDADDDGAADVAACSSLSFCDDCDDTDPDVHPGANEVPYDGIDQDCSGADESDLDEDGYEGGTEGDDCDDDDDGIHPAATEYPYDELDSDCDGLDFVDADEDGFAGGTTGDDCDDTDEGVHPDAADTCYDGVDSDCDGASEEDCDRDGVDRSTDCDDTSNTVFPGAIERCDGAVNDCLDTTWSITDEIGLVTRIDSTGDASDVRSMFAGSSSAPAAVALNTATYEFCDGTYHVALTVAPGAHAQVVGMHGDAVTRFDGDNTHRVFRIEDGQVDLRGVTVQRGNGAAEWGGGAFVGANGHLVASESTFQDNLATQGGGLAAFSGGTLSLTDTLLTRNRATRGGGAYIEGGSGSFLRTTFAANLGQYDSAGLKLNSTTVTIIDSLFDANAMYSTYAQGLALDTLHGTVTVSNTVFRDHVGGGTIGMDGGSLDLTGGEITGSSSPDGFGVVFPYAATVTIQGTNIHGNTSTAITPHHGANVTCDGGRIADNSSTAALAGGVELDVDSSFHAIGCDFGSNTDNAPADVVAHDLSSVHTYSYSGASTFTCIVGSCSAP